MTLPIKIIIQSVIQKISAEGIGIYVIQSGEDNRGTLYVKTIGCVKTMSGAFKIHTRAYDFHTDDYIWEINTYEDEQQCDNTLSNHASRDRDSWTIEIETNTNPFKDIF